MIGEKEERMEYKHSVSLDLDKCKGCTHCLRRCPTEAIRIRDGHAAINAVQCIDCGECIRVCPYKAKRAICDTLEDLDHSKYLIALPAPSLFGQFINVTDVDYVLQGLLDMGFDDVFEVSRCAEIITEYTRRYMKRRDIPRPAISSACPVVVRLITIRFPSLIDHIVPLMPPIELAGRMAKEEAMKKHPELKKEDIKTVFISPCPAKFSWVKNGDKEDDVPCVDYVVAISEVYFKLLNALKPQDTPKIASETGMIGLGWASSGGEGSALMNDRYLAADGIENVIRVLDSIEMGSFPSVDFAELDACSGGCVGGVLTVENPYIAQVRLQTLRRYMPVSLNHVPRQIGDVDVPEDILTVKPATFSNVSALNVSRLESIRMMADIENIHESLPALDCGSCGAPTCRAFAEDVVKGEAHIDECIVHMRGHLKNLMSKMEKKS